MQKIFFLTLVCLGFMSSAQAQKKEYMGIPSLLWPRLYNITYEKQTDPQDEFSKPIFSQEVLNLNGKEITLPGYMIPFTNGTKDAHFILSSLPINACFFCGVGGPEGVIEVFLSKPVSYTEKPVEVKGKFVINRSNPDRMMYVLEKAEFLGETDY